MSKTQRDIDGENRRLALQGEAARELMEHPAFLAAVNTVEREILERWASTKQGDDGVLDREEAFRNYHSLRDTKKALIKAIEEGLWAENMLVETAAERERDQRLRETEEMGMH